MSISFVCFSVFIFFPASSTCNFCIHESPNCFASYDGLCGGKTDSYLGDKQITVSGRECQHWSSQWPHTHEYKYILDYEYLPYWPKCRNPDGFLGPWCYTKDPNKRWELCFHLCTRPYCYPEDPYPWVEDKFRDIAYCRGKSNYFGNKTTTRLGYKCQNWNSQSPHTHDFGDNYDVFKDHCRNPSESKYGAWCFTTNSSVQWDYCFNH